MDTLAIFGSTGSIGKTSLNIFKKNKKKFNLLYLSAHNNYSKLKNLEKKFKPKNIILTNKKLNELNYLNDKKIILEKDLFKVNKKIDYVISGVSGYESLYLNLKLLKISKNLLIANKETIICGGEIFLKKAKQFNCKIIPIDSEHHCIDFFLKNLKNKKYLKKIYLCASGGPFLNKKIKYNESIKNVIKHPTWRMGKKISIDSSSLSNKILEMFEANILFKINPRIIEIIIEKTSNAHIVAQLDNNFYIPIIHKASMAIPISNALGLKNKSNFKIQNLNISFKNPKFSKFPLIKVGYKILHDYGQAGMIIYNVINDRLVNLFVLNKKKYGDISKNLVNLFNNKKIISFSKKKIKTLNDIKKTINFAMNIKI